MPSNDTSRLGAPALRQEVIDRLVGGFLSFTEWSPARKLVLVYALSVPLHVAIMVSFSP